MVTPNDGSRSQDFLQSFYQIQPETGLLQETTKPRTTFPNHWGSCVPNKGGKQMADFGKDGTRKVTTDNFTVTLRRSDGNADFLHYKLTAKGAHPIFSLASGTKTVWSDRNFPAPQMNYDRKWPKNKAEIVGNDMFHTLLLSFFTAVEYTLVVERCDKTGTVLETVKNIKYTSKEPSDAFPELLNVFIS
jgi:hypothetical protein